MGIVEKSVVSVSPGVGLWRKEGRASGQPRTPAPCLFLPSAKASPAYLGADAEMVVGDEFRALVVAGVEPAVDSAQCHTRERQHEGQEAPGAGCKGHS